ncbi:MAG: bifunctional metallophosphatase/5'-nucleotidase [Verrucomicrobiae bacterium]|nr:bifunctional metallophosphatase/5'-nucleotidase [Verrucomicrobiae bacterium]
MRPAVSVRGFSALHRCGASVRRLVFRVCVSSSLLVSLTNLAAREVSITVLHTTDLHGHIRPTDITYPKEEAGADMGGLARCATAIKKIRAETPNCLLLDNGDTIQGTAASLMSGGLMMIRAMNHMRYDAWTLGNHEFDWGLEKLKCCVAAAQMPILACNMHAPEPEIVGRLRPFLIKEMGGVRVAIIGLTTPGVPNWSRPRLIGGLKFESSVDALRRVLREVKRQKADIVLLAAHQGYRNYPDDHANQLRAVTSRFPEIDAIIGGHTHRPAPETFVLNILYSQANHSGTALGRMDFVYDTDRRKLASRKAQLLPMDSRVVQDPDVLALCKPDLDAADKELARVIGTAAADISAEGAPSRETSAHNLLCEAILDACRRADHPADIVIQGVPNERAEIKKGPIKVADCWEIQPYENFIGVFEATPDQLREILNENAYHYGSGHFAGVYGMKVVLKVSAPRRERVVSIADRDGKPFAPGRRLRVAVNSFDLASAGTRKPRLRAIADAPEAKLAELDVQVREALIEFIGAKKTIAPRTHGWWRVGGER